jgi:hypothetical protein
MQLLMANDALTWMSQQLPTFYNIVNKNFSNVVWFNNTNVPGTNPNLLSGQTYSLYYTSLATYQAQTGLPANVQVMYDIEGWTQTPVAEQQNPVGSIQAFAALAHSLGQTVMVTPQPTLMGISDANQANWPAEMIANVLLPAAPYVDSVALQFQRFESNTITYANQVKTTVTQLRRANVKLKIFAVLSGAAVWNTSGQTLVADWNSVSGVVDGLWYNPYNAQGGSPAEAATDVYFFQQLVPSPTSDGNSFYRRRLIGTGD